MITVRPSDRRNGQAGFTLAELLVSVIVLAEVLVAALMLFDANNKLARVQTQVAEMQQGLRISQYDVVREARMAGRGPLPLGDLPNGVAVGHRDNVAPDTLIALGNPDGLAPATKAVEGTDILTVRGVFSAPIYQINAEDPASSSVTTSAATIEIFATSPTNIPQDLTALKEAIDAGLPEAVLVVGSQGDEVYAVGELNAGASSYASDSVSLAVTFTGGTHSDAYMSFFVEGGVVPSGLTTAASVAFVGLVEEYRYYVREAFSVPGDNTTEPMPKLSRGRFFPGTEYAYGSDTDTRRQNLQGDIADNVIDFQVALGIDQDDDELVVGNEWLLSDPTASGSPSFLGNLYYLRVNTLVRTDRRDHDFQAEDLVTIENRPYDSSSDYNQREEKMYRRRLLQTVVELRNL